MEIWLFALVILLVGLALYVVAKPTQPKLAEIGRIMFFCGLLVLTWQFRGALFHVSR